MMMVQPSRSQELTDPLLFLAEGDAETWDSWSGSSHSLVKAIRAAGATVQTADVELRRALKYLSILGSISPRRRRWAARHHFGPIGFRLRSKVANRAMVRNDGDGPILQLGGSFDPGPLGNRPFFCYCDANAEFAARGRPYSFVSALGDRELKKAIGRERRVFSQATRIFTMSERLRNSFIEDYGIDAARVTTVHAGPNILDIPNEREIKGKPRSAAPTILFLGKNFERKGGPILWNAFQEVREAIPDARLVIAGSRPRLPAMPGVEVVGFVDRNRTGPESLKRKYLEADVFCLPSRYEPFGVVFVEAMLHGLPCIGTTAWAMPEIIRDDVTGWLVPPDDVGRLAETLIVALQKRERLREMGLDGRRMALERFTWTRVAEQLIDQIHEDA